MINNGTASAPEILAGALRDNHRAIIVGTRSFGKGSVQKVIPLSEKTAVKITVAKHYTPSGECIQAQGISSDIVADYAEVGGVKEGKDVGLFYWVWNVNYEDTIAVINNTTFQKGDPRDHFYPFFCLHLLISRS